MDEPTIVRVRLYRAGVGIHMIVETLEADKRGFSVQFMGIVNLGMRKGEPDCVNRFGNGHRGWGDWRCWSGTTATVTETTAATGDTATTTFMVHAEQSLVINLGLVLNDI